MSKLPDPEVRTLAAEVARLREEVRQLRLSSPYRGSGMAPNGQNGVVVDGDLIVDGELLIDGGEAKSSNYSAGTAGWHLSGDGRAEFRDVTLYDIPNSMLANPVDGKVGNVSATGFSLAAGSFVELAGQNITVPAGFTQALVSAGATVFSYNPNATAGSNGAGGDAIYCYVACGGKTSHPNPVGVSGLGGYGTSFSGAGFEFTNLVPGTAIRLSVYGCSAYQSLGSNPDNYANAYASVIWLR